MNRRTPAAALALLVLGFALVACAGEPAPAETTASPTPAPTTAAPSPTPTPTPTPTEEPIAEAPTCETLIAPSTIEIFTGHGWTFMQDDFRIGGDVIEGGIQCVWGDYTVASDHVQVFGWAPIDTMTSATAQQKLISEGWLRVDEDGHHYITEDPNVSVAVDENGYGMTYEFGDGWVTLADTRQSLVLIQRP